MTIVSEVPASALFGGLPESEEPPPSAPASVDRYPQDIPVAILAAVLAGSTFLPWYRSSFDLSPSGWSSGSWGPIILALAAGSFLLVVLRRLKIAVALPFEESLVHEGIGWISLIGIALKSRFRPGAGQLGVGYGIYVAIGAAVLLLLVAGRMSPHAPLVLRPGWLRGRAGKIGVALIVLVAAGAATFGVTNSIEEPRAQTPPGTVRGLPKCAEGFPRPSEATAIGGVGEKDAVTCQAYFSDPRSTADAVAAFRAALDKASWTYTVTTPQQGVTQFEITKPRCGQLFVVPDTRQSDKGSVAVVSLAPCTPPPTAPPG